MTRDEDNMNGPEHSLGRRAALLGAGGAVATVSLAGCLGSEETGTEDKEEEATFGEDDTDETEDEPKKHRRDSLDEAFACDVDMDMRFTNRMQLDGDPTGGDREKAVHVTSLGEESGDYPCMAVDLQDYDYDLGHLHTEETLSYDFYGGKKARYAVPDEVFLILKLADKRYHVVYRKKDVGKTGEWETRNVSEELPKDEWRAVEVDPKQIDTENERVLTTTEVVESRIEDLRHADTFGNLLERYGGDAKVVAVAMGAGRLTGRTITDHYFDNLRVGKEEFTIPAMLSMDVDFDHHKDDKGLTASLSFANPRGDEHGVNLEEIDAKSVHLAEYTSIAPPLPGTDEADHAVQAAAVDGKGDAAKATFDGDAVSKLAKDDRETTVLVYGAFEGKEPYTFLAAGEV